MVSEARVWEALRQVNDPEFPLSIVDLGMVYDVEVGPGVARIQMTFTAIGCPAIDMIVEDVKEQVGRLEGVTDVSVDVVWNPPWTKDKISPRGREVLQYYGVGV